MKEFLIVGCQRSGTTLMRLMLDSHPEIECVDEVASYSRLATASASRGGRLMGYKIPVWTEQLDQTLLRPNELAAFKGRQIKNVYAAHKIVFMLRNPLDVVASMRGLRKGGWQWLKDECVPVMEALRGDGEFQMRYKAELDRIRNSASQSVGLGALYWKWKTCSLLRYRHQGLPVHPIVYEQLVVEPMTAMREVLTFLGAEWHEDVLLHHQRKHAQVLDGKTVGGTDVNRAVDSGSVGKWSGVLSQSEVELVRDISGSLIEELSSVVPGASCWLRETYCRASGQLHQ